MEIEEARVVVDKTPLSPAVEAELRHRARVRSTHYSTRIEGNRLTIAEVESVLKADGGKSQKKQRSTVFHGRKRDVAEVRNYWNALLRVESWVARRRPLTEKLIRQLHALVHYGPRATPSQYRTAQNAIRDAATGGLVYMPPEAKDVPALMAGMVSWAKMQEKAGMPAPILAGLVHYQFVTIHPYFDGNGRTARLLATFVLHCGGYGLNGFYSLEEHHARDLEGYYHALVTHPHHNYYEGRADAALTPWVDYFLVTLAKVFEAAKQEATKLSRKGARPRGKADPARHLESRARRVLGLFAKKDLIATADVASLLGLSERMTRLLLAKWVKEGFLVAASAAKRNRAYSLSAIYRQSIGSLSAIDD